MSRMGKPSRRVNSPNVGVIFDVGNTIGTLDNPTEAADILGPYTVATHYKDFAIEQVARGFRFTMVPLIEGVAVRQRVFARRYAKGLVLVKPYTGGRFGDDTATVHKLPGIMLRPLHANGSAGETVTKVTLRNAEAAVLVK